MRLLQLGKPCKITTLPRLIQQHRRWRKNLWTLLALHISKSYAQNQIIKDMNINPLPCDCFDMMCGTNTGEYELSRDLEAGSHWLQQHYHTYAKTASNVCEQMY